MCRGSSVRAEGQRCRPGQCLTSQRRRLFTKWSFVLTHRGKRRAERLAGSSPVFPQEPGVRVCRDHIEHDFENTDN